MTLNLFRPTTERDNPRSIRMGCLGRHLAITQQQYDHLKKLAADPDMDIGEVWEAIDDIERALPKKYYQDTDKSWDNIHRALSLDNTPGGRLMPEEGDWPLDCVIFTEDQLCDSDDCIITCLEPDMVAILASALVDVDELWLRKRFFQLDPAHTYYDIDEDQFDYLWGWFRHLPEFFATAAAEGRVVLFTVQL